MAHSRPAIAPGLKLGALLVFIDTVKELPATLLLRPLNFETLATRAYSKASAGLFEHGAIDSLLIVAISGAAALLLSRRPDILFAATTKLVRKALFSRRTKLVKTSVS